MKIQIDRRSEKYYWTGTYELGVQEALRRSITPASVVWDIGAHVGFFSFLSARLGARHVHAFEPHAANRERLEWGVAANGLSSITIHAEAVTGADGIGFLNDRGSSLMASVSAVPPDEAAVELTCLTIDQLCDHLGPPDIIKIDVEGLEADVVMGAHRTLRNDHPILLVEVGDLRQLDIIKDQLCPYYSSSTIGPRHWLFT